MKLDSLFVIPWFDLPIGSSSLERQSPGFMNTNTESILVYLQKSLEQHYPELKDVSLGYKEVIKGCLSLAIVNANVDFWTDKKNPPRKNPNFVQFAIPLQTNFFLGSHILTQEDLCFFLRTQKDLESHPAYQAYKESLENKKANKPPQ